MKYLLFMLTLFFALQLSYAETRPIPGTTMWADLVMNGTDADPFYESVMQEHAMLCLKVKKVIETRGFLTERDSTNACDNLCHSIIKEKDCIKKKEKDNITPLADRLMAWAEGDVEFVMDLDVVDTWIAIFWRLWPLLLSIIPVVLTQMKSYRWSQAVFLLLCYGTLALFVPTTTVQKIYITVTTLACLISSGPYGVIPEVVGGLFAIASFVCVSFMTGIFFQFSIAIATVMLFVAWIGHAFMTRRQGAVPGILIMITVMMVMSEQVLILRGSYHLYTFNMDVFQMLMTSIIPYGDSWLYTSNGLRLSMMSAKHFVHMAPWAAESQVQIFFVFSIIQLVCCMVFRALFGMFIIIAMRYRFSASNMYEGYIIYMSDVFGGIGIFVRTGFLIDRFDGRKVAYATINLILLYNEFLYGIDILALRFIILFGDAIVFRTNYFRVPKYLNVDMNNYDFPQEGSNNWMALKEIVYLCSHVVSVKCCDSNGKGFVGLGFLRKLGNGSHTVLMSIKHVIADFDWISFDDHKIANPQPTYGSVCDDDPVAMLTVPSSVKGARIQLLDRSETSQVDSLFFAKLDNWGEVQVCRVTEFHFDHKFNIRASIDLNKGNSGGPVIALMSGSNAIRYAGCVSAGDGNILNGNCISSVTAISHLKSLDEEERNYYYDTDSDACSMDGKTKITVGNCNGIDNLVEKVKFLNKLAQSYKDKYCGTFWIDPAQKEGREARYYQDDEDIMDHVDNMYDSEIVTTVQEDKVKHRKKHNKKKKNKFQLLKEIKTDLRALFSLASELLTTKATLCYMKEVRCGFLPHLMIEDNQINFATCSSTDVKLQKFDYDD